MVPGERHVRGAWRDPAGHRGSQPCCRVGTGSSRGDVDAGCAERPARTHGPRELPGADAGQHADAVGVGSTSMRQLPLQAGLTTTASPSARSNSAHGCMPFDERPDVMPRCSGSVDHLLLRGELVTPVGGEPVRGPLARPEVDDDRRQVGHRDLADRRGRAGRSGSRWRTGWAGPATAAAGRLRAGRACAVPSASPCRSWRHSGPGRAARRDHGTPEQVEVTAARRQAGSHLQPGRRRPGRPARPCRTVPSRVVADQVWSGSERQWRPICQPPSGTPVTGWYTSRKLRRCPRTGRTAGRALLRTSPASPVPATACAHTPMIIGHSAAPCRPKWSRS